MRMDGAFSKIEERIHRLKHINTFRLMMNNRGMHLTCQEKVVLAAGIGCFTVGLKSDKSTISPTTQSFELTNSS